MSDRRIYLDVTMAARAGGRSDGIVRVIRELARYSLGRTNTALVVFDAVTGTFLEMDRALAGAVIAGTVIIDLPDLGSTSAPRSRRTHLRAWTSHPRRRAYRALDRLRVAGGAAGQLASVLQRLLTTAKYRSAFVGPDGERRRLLASSEATRGPMRLRHDDILVLCGSDWPAMNLVLRQRATDTPGRIVVLCHDIIPILFPNYFLPATARMFARCFAEVFRVADLIVFTTETVRRDALADCAAKGRTIRDTCVVPLGSSPPELSDAPRRPLPAGIAPGRYILYVSTFEPRKGHGMLLSAWKRIIAMPSFAPSGYRMVFVGRKGWLVDDLFARFAAEPCVGDTLLILSDVDDDTLWSLYHHAAFCVYPSVYEGFGLPVVESFQHGKAVIASSGGALPEVVAGLSPCLDPHDETAWVRTISEWIVDDGARQHHEAGIRARFRARSWTDMGEAFFAALSRHLPDVRVGT